MTASNASYPAGDNASGNTGGGAGVQHSYYATTQKQADGALLVTGWYDLSAGTNPAYHPDPATMTLLTAEDWQVQISQPVRTPWQIVDGRIAPCQEQVVSIPIRDQAQAALTDARNYVYNNYGILNEPTPAALVAYIRTLMTLASGANTSTTLPQPPAELAQGQHG